MNDPIAKNVQEVRERIAAAAQRAGRRASDITLVAVSKYATLEDGIIEAFLAAGCTDLGESRPQALLEKAEYFVNTPIKWHLIGSLQRNKIRKILPHVTLIHSIDSVRLAEAVDRVAAEEQLNSVDILLEVAVSGDTTKHGFEPDELPAALEKIACMERLTVKGLMCMAGLDADESETRRQFSALRQLADKLQLPEISMGMSDDFEMAVEEGATLVRIGSRLYGSETKAGNVAPAQ